MEGRSHGRWSAAAPQPPPSTPRAAVPRCPALYPSGAGVRGDPVLAGGGAEYAGRGGQAIAPPRETRVGVRDHGQEGVEIDGLLEEAGGARGEGAAAGGGDHGD